MHNVQVNFRASWSNDCCATQYAIIPKQLINANIIQLFSFEDYKMQL